MNANKIIRTNNRMEAYLHEISMLPEQAVFADILEILAILTSPLISQDECILIERLLVSPTVSRASFFDKTSYECFINHFHISDLTFDAEMSKLMFLSLGLKMSEILILKLQLEYPFDRFQLVVNFDGNDCSVRFYKKREEEALWLDEDLNEYQLEGIYAIEIMPSKSRKISD
jgi:hypothetical protein